MRLNRHLIAGLALLFCLDSTAAAPPSPTLQRRQDDTSSVTSQAPVSTTAAPSRSISISNSDATSTSEQPLPSSNATVSSISITPSASTNASAPQATSTDPIKDGSALPIPPKITPAMGIAGVILLITGGAFTFVGTKNKMLFVFLSAAYLSSLGVTLLIEYLASPPFSDALQGGFLVAAIFSGALVGGISLLFTDITENLGCLLGGFCLSMWLLSVKEGGLITSKTGQVIFICVLSGAAWSLAFSHYTRKYGLIVSVSFAGGTVIMLGIDCLSCAGWKEFWLYLWDVNSDIFPLGTNTYPLTKGIRVELASVVILAALGIVSQMQLWVIVKEHRQKRAERELERGQDLNREEEQVGQRFDQPFSGNRAQWVAGAEGKPKPQDSAIGTPKTSTSISEKRATSPDSVVAYQDQNANSGRGITSAASKNPLAPATVTVSVLRDEIVQVADPTSKPLPPKPATMTKEPSEKAPIASDAISVMSAHRSPSAVSPAVVPLPFPIPKEETDISDDASDICPSVNAEPESNEGTIPGRKRFSKRLSTISTAKPSSAIEDVDNEVLEDGQIVPHIEDDRASSIAATLDDEFDQRSLSDISLRRSSAGSTFQERAGSPCTDTSVDSKSAGSSTTDVTKQTPSDPAKDASVNESVAVAEEARDAGSSSVKGDEMTVQKPTVRQSLTISTDPKPNTATSVPGSPTSSRPRADGADSNQGDVSETGRKSKSNASATPSLSSQAGGRLSLSRDVLPDKLSKVALTYRTNEWAKHLQTADEPELDALVEPEPLTDSTTPEERPAPVSDEIAGIKPVKASGGSKRISADSCALPNALIRSNSNTSFYKRSPTPMAQIASHSFDTLPRSNSPAQYINRRSSSNPHLPGMPTSPLPAAQGTLMQKRESMLQNRFSSQSFQSVSSAAVPASLDHEDMTLAQRKQVIRNSLLLQQQQQQLLQQEQQKPRQKPPSASQKWQQAGWANNAQQMQGFDSHQPRRSSDGHGQVRREDMLAGWRESIRHGAVSPAQDVAVVTDAQRTALLEEKRRKELREHQREVARQERESRTDNLMRTGQGLEAHRHMLRRMQSVADKNAA